MSGHTNGTATQVRLDGAGLSRPVRDAGLSVAVDGTVTGVGAPEQVLRLLTQSGAFAVDDELVRVRIETTGGFDEYRFTGDLRHRLLFRRGWNRAGRVGVFYGLNPIRGDTDGPVAQVPKRTTLHNVVTILSADGPLQRIDVMNLFTYRSPDAASLPATPSDRVAVPALEREVLGSADVVLLAWGSKVGASHRPFVEDLLDTLDEVDAVPSMLERDGQLLTVGSPAQPAHPARLGHRGIRAVQVSRPTVLGSGTSERPPDRATHSAPEVRPAPVARPTPLQATPTEDVTVTPAEATDLLAWASGYLDDLGTEAVRRFLAGAVTAAPEPGTDLPPLASPIEIARRARTGGTAWGALQLACVALRVADGVAWWKPAARYILADTATNRRKVSGTWGKAARTAFEQLYGLEKGTADDAASSGATHDLDDTAKRWRVSSSEFGTVYGPGAPKQFAHAVVELINDGSARPCFRLS